MNNDNNDNSRFDKIYKLLGEDTDKLNNEETEKQGFNDIFNIFNNNKPNNEAYVNEINKIINNYHNEFLNDNNTNNEINTNESIDTHEEDEYIPTEEELNDIPIALYNFISSNNTDTFEDTDINNYQDSETDNNTIDNNIKINDNTSDNILKNDEIKEDKIDTEEPKSIFIEPTRVNISKKIIPDNQPVKIEEKPVHSENILRNKTIIENKELVDDIEKENRFLDFLSNKTTLKILSLLLFISVLILAIKAFKFGDIVREYNDYKQDNSNAIMYQDDNIDDDIIKKAAASSLVECISKPVDINNLPDNIKTVVNEINNYYKNTKNAYAFSYKDIFTGFTVSYNEKGQIFAASTIKAPVNIYLYEMASEGKIDLDKELTYTSSYYNTGTGILKNKKFNTNYTVRELSSYAIRNSDNAAHNMLMDTYGRNNILSFWKNLGTETILTSNNNWGNISSHDAVIYMEELYKFYYQNNEYGHELMDNFLNTKTKFIKGKNNYKVANKSGWGGNSQHDASIIFAENPYIVIALSNYGYDNNYMTHFNKVNDLAYNLHTEYWKYKTNTCKNIELYK